MNCKRHVEEKKYCTCVGLPGDEATISAYVRGSLSEFSRLEANCTLWHVHSVLERGKGFRQNVELWGCEGSRWSYVSVTAAQIEITHEAPMQKASRQLRRPPRGNPTAHEKMLWMGRKMEMSHGLLQNLQWVVRWWLSASLWLTIWLFSVNMRFLEATISSSFVPSTYRLSFVGADCSFLSPPLGTVAVPHTWRHRKLLMRTTVLLLSVIVC